LYGILKAFASFCVYFVQFFQVIGSTVWIHFTMRTNEFN